MEDIYYVYEWIRLDTNEPFYVGKGKGDRWRRLKRGNNRHFNNIVESIPCAVNILHNNLNEKIAYEFECYYIWLYRDEIGYDLVNINDGGEGNSLIGKNNPMYGKERTQEVKNTISEKAKERLKNKENHPLYGTHLSEETKMKASKTKKEKGIAKGKNNPRAISVICLTTKKIFLTVKDGANYYEIKGKSNISGCCKGKYKTSGKLPNGTPLKWKYLVWNHGKKYRVKEED